jgi:drug/metabolite transporter (DMT)-like permease
VIDYYINNITVTKSQAVGILIGFTGVLISINGEYLMSLVDPSFHFSSDSGHYIVTDIKTKILVALFAIFTNLVWGYAIVSQKKIKHIPSIKISYFLGIQFIFVSSIAQNLGFAAPVTTH